MSFSEKVITKVKQIPKGKVATYGQIAALAQSPRAARQVGWVLANSLSDLNTPWHRVINREGRVSIENLQAPKEEQVRRLQDEGVEVEYRDGNYWIDLDKYIWKN